MGQRERERYQAGGGEFMLHGSVMFNGRCEQVGIAREVSILIVTYVRYSARITSNRIVIMPPEYHQPNPEKPPKPY